VYAASELQYTAARKKFKHLGVVFMSRVTKGGARRLIHGLVNQTDLHELYRSVATKLELSNITKLSVFKSVCVAIFTYGHESWLMTDIILSQVQMAK